MANVLPEDTDEVNGEVADGEDDHDDDEHLGGLAPGAELHLHGGVRVHREEILIAPGSAMVVMDPQTASISEKYNDFYILPQEMVAIKSFPCPP